MAAPTDDDAPVRELTHAECWALLEGESLGRIAIAVAGDVEVFPINYVVADEALYFRTAPGSKLLGLTANPYVSFEIDGFDDERAHSVIVKGTAERLDTQTEIDRADTLPLTPWIPTLKYRWVRIRPTAITGRAFRRDAEPPRY